MSSIQQGSQVDVLQAPERRVAPRLTSDQLQAIVRQRRGIRRTPVTVLDFNRHGIALLSSQALRCGVQLIVELSYDRVITGLKVMGIVHNCAPLAEGFRCGIRFRPHSRLQLDPEQIEAYLLTLEAAVRCEGRESA